MKILIDEEVVNQALEKLELCWCVGSDKSEWDSVAVREFDKTITALRSALDAAEADECQPEDCDCVGFHTGACRKVEPEVGADKGEGS